MQLLWKNYVTLLSGWVVCHLGDSRNTISNIAVYSEFTSCIAQMHCVFYCATNTIISHLTLKVLNFWKLTSYCSVKTFMVGHGGSGAFSYLADPTSPIPSHCASIVSSTVRVNISWITSCMVVTLDTWNVYQFKGYSFLIYIVSLVSFFLLVFWFICNCFIRYNKVSS